MSGINRKVFLPSFLRYAVYQEQTCCFSVSSFIWFSSSSGLNKVSLQSKMVHDHLTYSVWASLEDGVTEMKVYCMEFSMQPAIMIQRPAYEKIMFIWKFATFAVFVSPENDCGRGSCKVSMTENYGSYIQGKCDVCNMCGFYFHSTWVSNTQRWDSGANTSFENMSLVFLLSKIRGKKVILHNDCFSALSQGQTHQSEVSAVGRTFYGVLVMWTPSVTSGIVQMFPM